MTCPLAHKQLALGLAAAATHLAHELVQQPTAVRDGEENAALMRGVAGRHSQRVVGQRILRPTAAGHLGLRRNWTCWVLAWVADKRYRCLRLLGACTHVQKREGGD